MFPDMANPAYGFIDGDGFGDGFDNFDGTGDGVSRHHIEEREENLVLGCGEQGHPNGDGYTSQLYSPQRCCFLAVLGDSLRSAVIAAQIFNKE